MLHCLECLINGFLVHHSALVVLQGGIVRHILAAGFFHEALEYGITVTPYHYMLAV